MSRIVIVITVFCVLQGRGLFAQWQGPANNLNNPPHCETTTCYEFEQNELGFPTQISCGGGAAPPQEVGCSNGGCAANGTACQQGPSEYDDYNEDSWFAVANKLKCSDKKTSPVAILEWWCKRAMPCTCAIVGGQGYCASVPQFATNMEIIVRYRLEAVPACGVIPPGGDQ
jgi:hypothetical protein